MGAYADNLVANLDAQTNDPAVAANALRVIAPHYAPTELENATNQYAGSASPVRGYVSGGYSRAADTANKAALDAERAGNTSLKQQYLAEADRQAQMAEATAPRVQALRDVHNVGDFANYAGGQVGSMASAGAPSIIAAGAIQAGGLALSPFTAGGSEAAATAADTALLGTKALRTAQYIKNVNRLAQAGAAVPFYQQMRNAAVTRQNNDPNELLKSPEQRAHEAELEGAANAALGSVVPGRLAQSALGQEAEKTVLGNVVKTGLEAGGIGAGMSAVSQAGQHYLDPNSQFDPEQLKEAAAAGVVGGGGLAALSHAPGVIAHTLTNSNGLIADAFKNHPAAEGDQAASVDLGSPPTPSTVQDRPAETPVQSVARVFGDKDAGKYGAVDLSAGNLVDPQLKNNLINIDAAHPDAEAHADAFEQDHYNKVSDIVDSLKKDPTTTHTQREALAGLGGDRTTPEALQTISNIATDVKTVKATNSDIGALDKVSTAKNNLADIAPAEQSKLQGLITSHLTDAAASNLRMQDPERLNKIANTLTAFSARAEDGISQQDIPKLLKIKSALGIFKDPEKLAADINEAVKPADGAPTLSFVDRIKQISNAQEDVENAAGKSFLESRINPDISVTPDIAKSIAAFVDEATTLDVSKVSAEQKQELETKMQALDHVFGGADQTQKVLDYYADKNQKDLHIDNSAEFLKPEGLNEKTSDTYKSATALRPFHNEYDAEELNKAADNGEIRSMQDVVNSDPNRDPNVEAAKLRQDIKKRAGEALRKNNDFQLGKSTFDNTADLNRIESEYRDAESLTPDKLLAKYSVVSKPENVAAASDAQVHKYASYLDAKKNTARIQDPVERQQAEDHNSTINKTAIAFDQEGKKSQTKLSAEAMWHQAAEEVGANAKDYQERVKQRFLDGLAGILNRGDFKLAGDIDPRTILDRKTGLTYGDIVKPSDEKTFRKTEAQQKAEDKQTGALQSLDRIQLLKNAKEAEMAGNTTGLNGAYFKRVDAELNKENQHHPVFGERQGTEGMARDEKDALKIADLNQLLDYTQQKKDLVAKSSPRLAAMYDTKIADIQARLDKAVKPRNVEEDTGAKLGVEKVGLRDQQELASRREAFQNEQISKNSLADGTAKEATPEEVAKNREEAINYVAKIRGITAVISDTLGDGVAGSYEKTRRLVQIALKANDHIAVAAHEAMHDFFSELKDEKLKDQINKSILNPHVMKQLRDLLKERPEAIKQIENDADERAAYAFQFFKKDLLKLRPEGRGIFTKLVDMFNKMLGVIGNTDRVEQIFGLLDKGELAGDAEQVNSKIEKQVKNTLTHTYPKLAGTLGNYYEHVRYTALEDLHKSQVKPLVDLANLIMREPGNETGGATFHQEKEQNTAKFLNAYERAINGLTAKEIDAARINLQSMRAPNSPLEHAMTNLLGNLFNHMQKADVRRLDTQTKEWVPIERVKNYFPRVWDTKALKADRQGFEDLLMKEGNLTPEGASAVSDAILAGSGVVPLSESESDLGHTPFSKAVNERTLNFINPKNAEQFVKYQSSDLGKIANTYVRQAVHRSEHTRFFGTDGSVIKSAMAQAAEHGASAHDIKKAQVAVMAVDGTLNHNYPKLRRDLQQAIMTAENIALLPLSLFTNMLDPLGVGMRTGEWKDVTHTYKVGLKGVWNAIRGLPVSDREGIAKMLGIIQTDIMLDNMNLNTGTTELSDKIQKINRTFFRLNGMDAWTRGTRIAAMDVGMSYILRHAKDERRMNELGIKPEHIFDTGDDTIALNASDIMAHKDFKGTPEDAQAAEEQVQRALFQFVDSGILRPNASQRPSYTSDPRWAVLSQFKQFTYSFQSVLLKRVAAEMAHDNYKPLMMAAAHVPVILLADGIRHMLTGSIPPDAGMFGTLARGVDRAGLLGIASFPVEAIRSVMSGEGFGGSSLLGPGFDHLMTILKGVTGVDSPAQVLARSLPLGHVFF